MGKGNRAYERLHPVVGSMHPETYRDNRRLIDEAVSRGWRVVNDVGGGPLMLSKGEHRIEIHAEERWTGDAAYRLIHAHGVADARDVRSMQALGIVRDVGDKPRGREVERGGQEIVKARDVSVDRSRAADRERSARGRDEQGLEL